MNINTIKEELQYVLNKDLNTFLGKDIKECEDSYIQEKFNEYAKTQSIKIKIKDLIDNYNSKSFLLNTPDGFQEVGDFYIKKNKNIIRVESEGNFQTTCSFDHKFQTSDGFKFAKDLIFEDKILTKDGYKKIIKLHKFSEKEDTYDFEVLHENHRYWSGNGMSSHNTGKTYIALSICREAIKKGYNIIYFDSEGSIDKEFVSRLGVDTSKVMLQPVNSIEQFNHIAAKLTQSFEEMEKNGDELPKVLVVLDSLGNLSSEKEITDSKEGSDKRDMTKQQAIRKLFRVNGMQFAKYGIPFIINNHVYACIFGDAKVTMADGSFKSIKDIKEGEEVLSIVGPKEVVETFQYTIKNAIELKFEDDYVVKCTKEHKFGIEKNNEIIWVRAEDLKEGDDILVL